MLFQIRSNHPEFSYLISKNPESGMLIRKHKKGLLFGYYCENCYNVYFRDRSGESYDGEELGYSSPVCVLGCLEELFKSCLNKPVERDAVGYEHVIRIVMLKVENIVTLEVLAQEFPQFGLVWDHIVSDCYQIRMGSVVCTLYQMLHFLKVVMGVVSGSNSDEYNRDEQIVRSMVNSLNILDAPYYTRYLMAKYVVYDDEVFRKVEQDLNRTKTYQSLQIKYGDVPRQNLGFVIDHLKFDKPIIDLSGEYVHVLSHKIGELEYSFVDVNGDQDVHDERPLRHDLENAYQYQQIDQVKPPPFCDVIVSNAVEKMGSVQGIETLKYIQQHFNFDKMVIIMPNSLFNSHYHLEPGQVRNNSNLFEPTPDKFKEFLHETFGKKWKVEYHQIGDLVDGQSFSQGAVVTRMDAN